MKFKIEEKVVFNKISNNSAYVWELNNGEIYIIKNVAFNKTGELFYAVESDKGTHTTWYYERDFVSLKKDRRDKLKKISFIDLTNSKGYNLI